MGILQCPDAINAPNLQIWNNAAFDSTGELDAGQGTPPWHPLQPISANRSSESLDHDSSKENLSPVFPKSLVSKKSPVPVGKPFRLTPMPAKHSRVFLNKKGVGTDQECVDDGDIDTEIKEIEKEIGRLSSRLEALHIKKVERDLGAAAAIGRRGRVVPAKFLDPKQSSIRNPESPAVLKKIEESPASAKLRRRGISLGPSEISAGIKLLRPEMPDITPIQSVKSRRKSCVWKHQDINEEEETKESRRCLSLNPKSRPSIAKASDSKRGTTAIRSKRVAYSLAVPKSVEFRKRGVSLGPSELAAGVGFCQPGKKLQEIKEDVVVKKVRGRSLSPSPNSRQSITKASELRKGVVTVGSKKPVKGEDVTSKSLQPKILFQEPKKSAPSKRPLKNVKVRTVASRYSLITVRVGGDAPESKRRKWSLPDNIKEEMKGVKKPRVSLSEVGRNPALVNREERQWEIPCKIEEETDSIESSPPSITKIAESLPKIRTIRCVTDSPRDSGPAKRVAELIGRRSHFGAMMKGEAATSASRQILEPEEDEP